METSYCWGSPGDQIGPPFFSRHGTVNDFKCEAPLYKYVDDCAITETIRPSHSESSNLQREIDHINNWSIDNNMKLDAKKTKEFNISMSHIRFQPWL